MYRALDTPRRRLVMDVTVLPTTAGVLAVGCAWPVDFMGGGLAPDCASSVESISVRGAVTLKPSRSVALASELPAVIARLDHARADGRAALSRARTPEAQAAAAHRLARHHMAAAERLRVAFGNAAKALTGQPRGRWSCLRRARHGGDRRGDGFASCCSGGSQSCRGKTWRRHRQCVRGRHAHNPCRRRIDLIRRAGNQAGTAGRHPTPLRHPRAARQRRGRGCCKRAAR